MKKSSVGVKTFTFLYCAYNELAEISQKQRKTSLFRLVHGGAYRIRTGDLYNANVARYQLC